MSFTGMSFAQKKPYSVTWQQFNVHTPPLLQIGELATKPADGTGIPDGRSVVRPLTVTMQTFPNINNTLESSVSAMPASKVDGLNVNKKKGNMISHGSTKSLTDSMRKEFAHGCASAMAIPFTV